jgi:hypothetical protein
MPAFRIENDGSFIFSLRLVHAPVKTNIRFLCRLTYGQLKGFTLYATRTILSGGGTELVELTRTNLRELEAG